MGLYNSVTGGQPQGYRPIIPTTADPYLRKLERENVVSTILATDPYTRNKIEIVYVISSHLVAAGYDPVTEVLTIEFRAQALAGGGRRYQYPAISLDAWKSFKRAASKGKWLWAYLRRPGHPYRRIR